MTKISKKGNYYVVKVKGNQKKLLSDIQQTVSKGKFISCYCSEEITKGRLEIREYFLYKREDNLNEGWETINTIIYVKRDFLSRTKEHTTESFYVTNLSNKSVKFLAKGIRSHWHIENKLHYTKDVIMREDKECTKNKQAAANLALLRDFAFNILKDTTSSIKYAIETYVNYPVNKLRQKLNRT